jgi:hypothetical protein
LDEFEAHWIISDIEYIGTCCNFFSFGSRRDWSSPCYLGALSFPMICALILYMILALCFQYAFSWCPRASFRPHSRGCLLHLPSFLRPTTRLVFNFLWRGRTELTTPMPTASGSLMNAEWISNREVSTNMFCQLQGASASPTHVRLIHWYCLRRYQASRRCWDSTLVSCMSQKDIEYLMLIIVRS